MNQTVLQSSLQTVLVLDDDEFSREILRKKLEFLGVKEIYMAHDGRDGLAIFDTLARELDFLICDIFMPDMDGIEFMGALAERKFAGSVILVTGVNRDMMEVAQYIASMKGLRVLGTFTKPLHHETLGKVMGFAAS